MRWLLEGQVDRKNGLHKNYRHANSPVDDRGLCGAGNEIRDWMRGALNF